MMDELFVCDGDLQFSCHPDALARLLRVCEPKPARPTERICFGRTERSAGISEQRDYVAAWFADRIADRETQRDVRERDDEVGGKRGGNAGCYLLAVGFVRQFEGQCKLIRSHPGD